MTGKGTRRKSPGRSLVPLWALLALAGVARAGDAAVVLSYCGYIGGAFDERGLGIAVDAAGSAIVTGYTSSPETTFPVAVGPDLTYGGGVDAFVARVRADGTALTYAGYIGGNGDDFGYGIAVDAASSAFITGYSTSSEVTFPVFAGPGLRHNGGFDDAFVAHLSADGTSLIYAGYVGGNSYDYGNAIAVDGAGSAYVIGDTSSTMTSFPVAVGPDLTENGGSDVFVVKVRPDGTGLVYAGYIGGDSYDYGNGIAVDAGGSAFVIGYTSSTQSTFPVAVGPDLTLNGGAGDSDAFVARVRPDGSGLVYAGYIGGARSDYGSGIAVDAAGNATVTGYTGSTEATFPVAVGPDTTHNGGAGNSDAYVARVRTDGSGLQWAGYIGGDKDDYGTGAALDAGGDAYIAGGTYSPEASFPAAGGPDLTYNGGRDGFVARVRADGTALLSAGYVGGEGDDYAVGIAVGAPGTAFVTGGTASPEATFPVVVGPDLTYNSSSLFDYDAFVAGLTEVTASCTSSALPIAALTAVQSPSSPGDIELGWQADTFANGYNLWYVTAKTDVPLARQASSPPAVPVSACAVPSPASGVSCTDAGAVTRNPALPFYYQVRAYCDPANEGP